MRWHLHEVFVLRTPGFAFDALQLLALPATAAALDALRALEQQLVAQSGRAWSPAHAAALVASDRAGAQQRGRARALQAMRQAVRRLQPVAPDALTAARDAGLDGAAAAHWNTLAHERARLLDAAQDAFAAERPRALAALWRQIDDPAFQEAVFLSSPDAWSGLERGRAHALVGSAAAQANSKQRALERLAWSYLQRLSAKNDTTSFFGPVQYGCIDGRASRALAFEVTAGARWSARRTYMAHWAVAALARRIAEDDAVFSTLRPSRSPLLSGPDPVTGAWRHHGSGRSFTLPTALADLLVSCDGHTPVEALALRHGPGALADLRRLAALRVVDCSLRLPSTEVDALRALLHAVQALPPAAVQARHLVAQAEAHRAACASAAWPDRRRALQDAEAWLQTQGVQTRRHGGQLYGDRLALYEDCAGPLSGLRIGGALHRRLVAELPPVLQLLTAAAVLRRLDARDLVCAALQPGEPFLDLVRRLPATYEPGARERALHERLHGLLQAVWDDTGIGLPPASIEQVLDPWRGEIASTLASCPLLLPSPDVMVAAASAQALEQGDFTLVLAELHDDCSTVYAGFFADLHADPASLRRNLEDRIRRRPGWQSLAGVLGERRSKHVTPELPGRTLLLSGTSVQPEQDCVPMAEVRVVAGADGPQLLARGQAVQLYPGDLRSPAHLAFALPCVVPLDWLAIAGRPRVPRIAIGGLVVQRAAWLLDGRSMPALPAGPAGLDGLRLMRDWLAAHGVPRWSFARWSRGDKPMLVDQHNPWSLEVLERAARGQPSVCLTEMYPDPDQLFLDLGRGRQTFELRLATSHEPCAAVPPEAHPLDAELTA